ncbi:MAG: hypothetical protein ACI8VW_001641, partial [bacterium]
DEDVHRFELSYVYSLKKLVISTTLREAQLSKKNNLGELGWLHDNHIFTNRDG